MNVFNFNGLGSSQFIYANTLLFAQKGVFLALVIFYLPVMEHGSC